MTTNTLQEQELDSFIAFAAELSDAAHAMLAPAGRLRPDTTVKADRSFVTAFDIEIEQRLRAMIAEPAHAGAPRVIAPGSAARAPADRLARPF